jgi:hypothetical protein
MTKISEFCLKSIYFHTHRVLQHFIRLRHETKGLSSLEMEVMPRIFAYVTMEIQSVIIRCPFWRYHGDIIICHAILGDGITIEGIQTNAHVTMETQ